MGAVNEPLRLPRRVPACAYNADMYIIAIGWLWVALMMAITESNIVAGILSFVFYGLLPCCLLLWLLGTPARRQRQQSDTADDTDGGQGPA